MRLEHIELKDLKISPANVRKHGGNDVSDILPSIRSIGVIQSLLVRRNCDGYEVVAGRRRWRSCQLIAEDGGTVEPLPCIVLEDGDDAKAIEASLAENIARLPMDEVDQYKAFAALKKQGHSDEDIASRFGVTELLVRKRLAIANLITPILSAYRKGDIDVPTVRQLTMATKAQQKEWLRMLRDPEIEEPTGRWLKSWLLGGEAIPVSHALFPVESYDGKLVSDLFEDGQFFDDPEKFWKLQMEAVQPRQQHYLDEGWSDVVIMDGRDHWSRYDKVRRAKKDGGKVYIQCRTNGEVEFHEGWLEEKEAKRLDRAAAKANGEVTAAPKAELTKAATRYCELHRHGAVRAELLKAPQIALRLMVAHVVAGSDLWEVKPETQDTNRNEAIAKSIEASKAQKAFAKEREAVRTLLQLEDGRAFLMRDRWATGELELPEVFARLLRLSDKEVMRVLTFAMGETLASGTAVVEALGHILKVDMANWWEPEDAFFDLLRDKPAINAIVAEVAGKRTARDSVSKTAKAQKATIRGFLDGRNGLKKPEGWLPGYMHFPMQGYTRRKGLVPAEQWSSVRKLFEPEA